MPSTVARRLVEPSYRHVPVFVETYGPEFADVSSLAGYYPDPEQEDILNALGAIRADGRSSVFDTTVIAPRQTIKTGLEKMAVLGWLFVTDQRLVVWSSHEMDTTSEAHTDLASLIESTPALSKRLKRFTYAPGKQLIELKSGQRVKFKARTTGSGRGLTGDKIVLDEGYALKPAHMGALLPTLNAVPDPQLLIGSSAGMLGSAVLRSFRDRGRSGRARRSAYFEWGAPRVACDEQDCSHVWPTAKGCALDRRDLWESAIMTYGTRTNEEKIQAFRETMPADEFAREFLVWWEDPGGSGPFAPGTWANCGETDIDPEGLAASKITGPVHVAVDVTWNRRWGALGVSGTRDDGKTQIELVDEDRNGIGWLAKRAADVAKRHGADGVILDPTSAAGSLIPALRDQGVEVVEVTGRELAQACGWIYDAVIAGRVVHLSQMRLDTAVSGAVMKPSEAAWRWDRRMPDADISPLMAVTLAAWKATGQSGSFNIW